MRRIADSQSRSARCPIAATLRRIGGGGGEGGAGAAWGSGRGCGGRGRQSRPPTTTGARRSPCSFKQRGAVRGAACGAAGGNGGGARPQRRTRARCRRSVDGGLVPRALCRKGVVVVGHAVGRCAGVEEERGRGGGVGRWGAPGVGRGAGGGARGRVPLRARRREEPTSDAPPPSPVPPPPGTHKSALSTPMQRRPRSSFRRRGAALQRTSVRLDDYRYGGRADEEKTRRKINAASDSYEVKSRDEARCDEEPLSAERGKGVGERKQKKKIEMQ